MYSIAFMSTQISQDRIDTIELDISNSDSIDKFIQEFTTRFHQADILINNAAVAVKSDDFNLEVVQFTFKPNFYDTSISFNLYILQSN